MGKLHSEPLSVLEYQKEHHTCGELYHNPCTLPRCFTPNRLSWFERQISGKQVLQRQINSAISVPDKEKQAE